MAMELIICFLGLSLARFLLTLPDMVHVSPCPERRRGTSGEMAPNAPNSSGEVGHAYIKGRRKACAEAAALVDGLMQTAQAEAVQTHIIDPLEAEQQAARAARAAKAAATKVDFFTMVRGED